MEFNCVKLHFSIEICNANLHFSEKYLFEKRSGDGGGVLGELLGGAGSCWTMCCSRITMCIPCIR